MHARYFLMKKPNAHLTFQSSFSRFPRLNQHSSQKSIRFFSNTSDVRSRANYQKLHAVGKVITQQFSLRADHNVNALGFYHYSDYDSSRFYPFSNEPFLEQIRRIEKMPPKSDASLCGAILVGESNVLSTLPELANIVDTIIFNDLDRRVHENIQFMFKCLLRATSISDFNALWEEENPLVKYDYEYANEDHESFFSMLFYNEKHLKEKFFLSSEERFLACKKAAEKLVLIYTNINLYDTARCTVFSKTLKENAIKVVLVNFTNLFDYDRDRLLVPSLKTICHDDTILLYSRWMKGGGFSMKCRAYQAFLDENIQLPIQSVFNNTSKKMGF